MVNQHNTTETGAAQALPKRDQTVMKCSELGEDVYKYIFVFVLAVRHGRAL